MTGTTAESVVEAAIPVLLRDRSASMRTVAEAAGISRTTLTRLFPTREVLVTATAARVISASTQALAECGLDARPTREVFDRLCERFLPIAQVWGFIYVDPKLIDLPGLESEPTTDALTAFFEDGQRSGFFRSDVPPRWLAYLFCSVSESAWDLVKEGYMGSRQAPGFVKTAILDGVVASSPDVVLTTAAVAR